jgi:hypothetical protein
VVRRAISAFFRALRLTLRGEALPPAAHPALWRWMQETTALVDAVYAAADSAGLDTATRQTLTLHLDGRDWRVETILATVKHHAVTEYVYLLHHPTPHSLTAIYASNMDDHYRVTRLQQAEVVTKSQPIAIRLAALAAHLETIPPEGQSLGSD